MHLYLIRHAQSANNANPPEMRVADPPLTDLGHAQSRLLARHIATLGLHRLITSPFRRALQTTEQLRHTTRLTPEVWIDLHESGGCVHGIRLDEMVGRPGMTREEILREFPEYQLEADIDGTGWWRSRPYESDEQARARAARLLDRTRAEFGGTEDRVAYVMHGDFGMQFLRSFHTLPEPFAFNASITHVQVSPDEIGLFEFNQIGHLPRHMLSW